MHCPAEQIIVTYPSRPGYTLLAHTILQAIGNRFGLSGRLREDPADRFTIRFREIVIHSCQPEMPAEIDPMAILAELGKHAPPMPEKNVVAAAALDDSDDPEHRRWMNSCCSGE